MDTAGSGTKQEPEKAKEAGRNPVDDAKGNASCIALLVLIGGAWYAIRLFFAGKYLLGAVVAVGVIGLLTWITREAEI